MNSKKISFQWQKALVISTDKGEQTIQAASGLVKQSDTFYVIADDELSLVAFNLSEKLTGYLLPLLPGALPTNPQERKKLKPDWEGLVYFPSKVGKEGLLTLPSGSKPNRQFGFFLEINANKPSFPKQIDFSLLYQKLQNEFAELNIEGGLVTDSILKVFQRGNGSAGQNAIIDLELQGIITDINTSGSIQASRILNSTSYDLGNLNGSRLSFTDACMTNDNQIFFLAVAEQTLSTYDDGEYKGAVLGRIDKTGQVIGVHELDCPYKPEGLWIEHKSDRYEIYVVTDADDPNRISTLYGGEFSVF